MPEQSGTPAVHFPGPEAHIKIWTPLDLVEMHCSGGSLFWMGVTNSISRAPTDCSSQTSLTIKKMVALTEIDHVIYQEKAHVR